MRTFGDWLDRFELVLEGGRTPAGDRSARWFVTISELKGVREDLAGEWQRTVHDAGAGDTMADAVADLYGKLRGKAIVIYGGFAKPDRNLIVPNNLEPVT